MMQATPIKANLKFLANLDAPLVYIASRGGGDQTEHVGNFNLQEVRILDARQLKPSASLDVEGFCLVQQETKVEDFYDGAQIESIWHEEIKALLKAQTRAKRVEIFDDTRRSASRERQKSMNIREPADIVHNDYTATSGIKRLRDYFANDPDAAEQLLQRRFAIINVWRSIAGPVANYPVALCDASSVIPAQLVSMERRADERIGEIQVALFGQNQSWYYFPAMQMNEALLIKTYDSAVDGRARFTIHTSFEDPSSSTNAPARESIETRCFVFF